MKALILQTPIKGRKGNQMLRNWEMIAKDDCMHAASINTTHKNTAPTMTQVQNIDHVQDLVFPRFRN